MATALLTTASRTSDDRCRVDLGGLTRGSTMAHIARAALESIAFQSAALLDAMSKDAIAAGGVAVAELRVDGGASANDLLMQFQADLLGIPVLRPKVIETTALGAAYLAGLATGFWRDRADVSRAWQMDRVFEPREGADYAAHRRARWREALRRAGEWEEHSTVKAVPEL